MFFNLKKSKVLFLVLAQTVLLFQAGVAQYDFAIDSIKIIDPVGINAGDTINYGTALNMVTIDIVNAGTNTIPAGTQTRFIFEVEGVTRNFSGSLLSSLAPGGREKYFVNCSPAGSNLDYPNKNGGFDICATYSNSNDNNAANNKSCTQFAMKNVPPPMADVIVQPNSIQISNPTGVNRGDSIPLGTQFNEYRFVIENAGNLAVPTGDTLNFEFKCGIHDTVATIVLTNDFVPGGTSTITVNATPSLFNLDFPTTVGPFDLCATVSTRSDTNKSNDNFCQPYSMFNPNPPSITNMSPVQGGVGTSVTISGLNLDTTSLSVTFQSGIAATIISKSPTSIVLNVPSGAQTGNVTVNSNGVVLNAGNFTIVPTTPPTTITSMNPNTGAAGTVVEIRGSNLPTTAFRVDFFNAKTATVISASDSLIKVVVPTGAVTGNVELDSGGTKYNCGMFTIATGGGASHTITSFSPLSAAVGSEITLLGTGFNTTTSANTVLFSGGSNAVVKTATATELVFDVPAGAQSGPIYVIIASSSVSSADPFKLVVPGTLYISDFNPKKAAVGQDITVKGDQFNLTPMNNTITFAGNAVGTVKSGTAKEIVVTVPSGAIDGIFTLDNGTATVSTPVPFEVDRDPVITSISPEEGLAGSSMKIIGYNFSKIDTENKVTFGSVDAGIPFVNTDATELEVTVPASLLVGEQRVRLLVSGLNTVEAPKKFKVIEDVNSIDENGFNGVGLSVYSNSNGLNILIKSKDVMTEAKIKIVDLSGSVVFEQGFYAEGKNEVLLTNDLNLDSGTYVVSLESDNLEGVRKKFVVTEF